MKSNGMRETYFSDTYTNKLYEKEVARPKNIRELASTFTQDNAAFHDFGRKKDGGVVQRRAMDHRDLLGSAQKFNTITGSVRKSNLQVDQFKQHSESATHRERKHYDSK